MTPRLKELYYKEIQPALKEQLGFKNTFRDQKYLKLLLIWVLVLMVLMQKL